MWVYCRMDLRSVRKRSLNALPLWAAGSTVFQQRRFGTTRKWVARAVCAQVSTGPKMRGARLDHAADDTPAAPQRRQGCRYGTCSAGQRPVPDVIRRAIERDGRLRPPRTAPRSGPPRPRRPPAAPRRRPPRGDRPAPRPRSAAPSVRSSPVVGSPRMPSSLPAVWKDPAMVVRYAASVSTREGAVSRYVPALFRPIRPGHKGEDPSPVPE